MPWSVSRRTSLSARTAAILVGGQEGGDIPLAVLAVPVERSPEKSSVLLIIDADTHDFAGDLAAQSRSVEVVVYALSEDGGVVASVIADLTPPVAMAQADFAQLGLKLLTTVEAPIAIATVRALVRTPAGAFGLHSCAVAASEPAAEPIGGLLIADDPAGWCTTILEPGWSMGSDPSATGSTTTLIPASRPLLVPGEATTVAWLARGVPPGTARFRLLMRDGSETVAEVDVPVRGRAVTAWPGIETLVGEVKLPLMPPGRYTVSAMAPTVSAPIVGPELPVIVTTREDAVGALTWTRLPSAAEAVDDGSGSPFDIDPAGVPSRELANAYAKALAELAKGGMPAARAAVARIELAALVRGAGREFRRLATAELAVARRLAAADDSALAAIVLVHLDLYRHYSETKAFLQLTHSRQMLVRLLSTASSDAQADGGRALRAELAVAVAACLEDYGLASGAEDFFLLALGLDPRHPAALIGVASFAEHRGAYGRAAEALIRLLAVRPDHAEARLRLAVNLSRLGQKERAAELLRDCQDARYPSWIRSVAYQQAAISLLAQSSLAAAQELLARAREALPEDPQLGILEAYVAEQRGQLARARQIVSSLFRRSGGQGESARFRYTELPKGDLEATLARIQELTPRALAGLERALQTSPMGGDS